QSPEGRVPYRVVETDSTGRFELKGVPREGEFAVRVSLPLPQNRNNETLLPRVFYGIRASPGAEPLVFSLRRGVYVEGRVVAPDGFRMAQGEVVGEIPIREGGGIFRFIDATLDRTTGRFRLGPVERGGVRVFFRDFTGSGGLTCRSPVEATAPAT